MSVDAARVERATPRAWVIWGTGALCFTYAFFHRVSPSVMVDELMRDFAVGGAILGNLSAVYFYTYASIQIPVGLVLDRWGPRRVLSAAIMLAAVGSFIFATAESLALAYLGRLLIGAGVAFGFVGSLTLATSWFPIRRFALVSGLTMFAGMAGGIGGQAPQAAMVEAIGWRGTVMWAGAAGIVLAAVVWLLVRDRPAGAAREAEATTGDVLAALGRVLRNPQTWIIALYGGMMSAPMLAFGALWGVPYLMQTYGIDRPTAGFSTSLGLVGWAAGAPLAGWISDRAGRRKAPMLFGALVSLATMSALLYLPGVPLLAVQALLFVNGVAAAAMVLCYAAAREHNPGPVGAAYGFINMATTSGGALFQPFIGWLLDVNWDGAIRAGARVYSDAAYDLALLILPACFAVAVLAAMLLRETWCRPVET